MPASQQDLEQAARNLPDTATMRDIFDFCKKFELHNLAQGMIELPPPKLLREIAADVCINHPEAHQYRNRSGEDEYRAGIVNLLSKFYNTNAPKEAILATSGVTGAIFSTMMFSKGEKPDGKIGLLVPFYTYHAKQATEAFRRPPVYIDTNKDWTPNWENIEAALKDGVSLIIFCNPGNPQANVWKKEDVRKLVDITKQYGARLLIDEVYSDLVWKGKHYSPIQDSLEHHVVVARGFSKSLGAQSWRCGYLVSSPETTAKLMAIHDPIYISVPWQQHAIGQYLSKHYQDYERHVQELSDLMQTNWKILSVALQQALGWEPIEPEGSMYGMFYHKAKSDKEAVVAALLNGVGVAPGKMFYPNTPENTGYVRIHVGISTEKAKDIAQVLSKKSQK
eukprot:TRINITY_DN2250_c0_g1_i1.p1 TRINITY_DN2250_c0_g1~~TRINITY_DN2250_c0_g1_i1.p1  ORF type:complete len:393 (+),score=109.65 TRINITY_DN2250_c0_g1_i1:110-1288(+)